MERTSLVRAHGRWSLQTNKQAKTNKQAENQSSRRTKSKTEQNHQGRANQSTNQTQTSNKNKQTLVVVSVTGAERLVLHWCVGGNLKKNNVVYDCVCGDVCICECNWGEGISLCCQITQKQYKNKTKKCKTCQTKCKTNVQQHI